MGKITSSKCSYSSTQQSRTMKIEYVGETNVQKIHMKKNLEILHFCLSNCVKIEKSVFMAKRWGDTSISKNQWHILKIQSERNFLVPKLARGFLGCPIVNFSQSCLKPIFTFSGKLERFRVSNYSINFVQNQKLRGVCEATFLD